MVSKAKLVTIFKANQTMKRLSAPEQIEYYNDKRCSSYNLINGKVKRIKVCYYDNIWGLCIAAVKLKVFVKHSESFKISLLLIQQLLLQCALDCLRVKKAIRLQNLSDQSKYNKYF